MDELYNLLKNKEIISILDGDKAFEEVNGIRISMPYLSGPDLCRILTYFGSPAEYSWKGGSLSRWMYMENLINHCIETNKTQQLLSYLFSKDKFVEQLKGLTPQEIDETYKVIINTSISQISGLLYFGGNEFTVINRQFIVRPINSTIEIEAPVINIIDSSYIKSLSERATEDIEKGNYDSSITKCRTLLEEVFCYVIELKNEIPTESGEISSLYNQVKSLYIMHQNKDVDKRINTLLSGLEKIVISISQMRNKESDAHGVGSRRINISEHHARLLLNASIMMSDFILAVAHRK